MVFFSLELERTKVESIRSKTDVIKAKWTEVKGPKTKIIFKSFIQICHNVYNVSGLSSNEFIDTEACFQILDSLS